MGLLAFTLASNLFSKQQPTSDSFKMPVTANSGTSLILATQSQIRSLACESLWDPASRFLCIPISCHCSLTYCSFLSTHPVGSGLRTSLLSLLNQAKLSPRYLHVSVSNFIQVPFKWHLTEKSPPTCSMRKRFALLLDVFYALPLLFLLCNCSPSSLVGALSIVFNAPSLRLQCLVHSRCSVSICGMSEYIDIIITKASFMT